MSKLMFTAVVSTARCRQSFQTVLCDTATIDSTQYVDDDTYIITCDKKTLKSIFYVVREEHLDVSIRVFLAYDYDLKFRISFEMLNQSDAMIVESYLARVRNYQLRELRK